MGRYVLGILAVVVMQIAFSLYMWQNSSEEQTAVVTSTNVHHEKAGLTEESGPAAADLSTVTAEDTNIDTPQAAADDTARVGPRRRAWVFAQRGDAREIRLAKISVPHRSNFQNRIPAEQVSVEREYFGRMVVEKTFWPAKARINRSSAMVRRQTFGRMVVEHTSGV